MLKRSILVLVAGLGLVSAARAQDASNPPQSGDTPGSMSDAAHPLEGLWELRMERKVWWPNLVPGSLVVSRGPHGIRGSLTFDPMWGINPKPLTFAPSKGDTLRFDLGGFGTGEPIATIDGTVRDGVFVGKIEWIGSKPPETCFISAERLAPARRFEPDTATEPLAMEHDPTAVGIDAAALDRIILYAGRYDTDALVVVKDGRVVCDRTFLRPRGLCETEAITSAIASLAIPLLVDEGKLPRDLDTPLSTWFPEWKSDPLKSKITLRHVLTHATGLQQYSATASSKDYLASAVQCAAVREPGTRFEANAQALELLSGIVAKAAGEQIDTYIERRVFRPLGIARWRWPRDAAGNTPTYGALELHAEDLARIGWLLADGGRWQKKQIVPSWWIEEMSTPSPTNEEVGLVWSLLRDPAKETVFQTQAKLDRLQEDGFADAARLTPLVGKSFESRNAWWKAAADLLGRDAVKALYDRLGSRGVGGELRGPVTWIYLQGSRGQCLLLSPATHTVVVRDRRAFAESELPKDIAQRAGFGDLPTLVQELTW